MYRRSGDRSTSAEGCDALNDAPLTRDAEDDGARRLWDRVHAANETQVQRGLLPLRTAPERAILRATLVHGRFRPDDVVVELGCGGSRFLPCIARATGVAIAGVDFSPEGIRLTRAALAAAGVDDSRVVEATIEDYVQRHREEFDASTSFGLVEHFADLDAIVRAHFNCVRIGGRVVISAPNLCGLNLHWAQAVSPSVLTWHHPISARALVDACLRSGGSEIVVVHLGGIRLFTEPDLTAGRRTSGVAATVLRKFVNGGSEIIDRLVPNATTALSRAAWSPHFLVAATRSS